MYHCPVPPDWIPYPDTSVPCSTRLELTVGALLSEIGIWSGMFTVNASTLRNEFKELPQEEIITGTKKLVVGFHL